MGNSRSESYKSGMHSHTTIIYPVKQLGDGLAGAPLESNIPEVTEQG